MRHTELQQYFSADTRALAFHAGGPWLQRSGSPPPVAASDFRSGPRLGSAWANTVPAALDSTPQADLFCEPLLGLSIREVTEPEVFAHFFGSVTRS